MDTQQSSIYLVLRKCSDQHICTLRFPRLLVTFWANWGNQPASVLGCPSTGRPTPPSRCFQADTTCNTALHTPAVFAGSSGAQGLSVSWAFSSCHRHPCLKPVSAQASPNSPWSTNWGGARIKSFPFCFVQEWEPNSLGAECPSHERSTVWRVALPASPADAAPLCKIKY